MLNAVKRWAIAAVSAVKEVASKAVAAIGRTAAVVSTGLVAGVARAQSTPSTFTLDTTSVVTTIANGVTALSAIGLAVLSLIVVIRMFKWAQRTL
jgi:putative copper export protein